jgi:two-component system nitrate/nitrite response regulator NarL
MGRLKLTGRQREVLTHLAEGQSNKEIARRMRITEGTVKMYLHHLYQLTRTNNRTALALRFIGALSHATEK